MADVVTESTQTTGTRVRRRASREAGPTGEPATARVMVGPAPQPGGSARVSGARYPGRRAHTSLVAVVAVAVLAVLTAALAGAVTVQGFAERDAEAAADRQQRFVDTASQLVVNMFTFSQDDLDASVDRWVNDLTGPLGDKFQPGNVTMLKDLFRDTGSDSEAVINVAALEDIDENVHRASVLVAARVTATDIDDGVNQPSQPYRLRVIVQEDDAGAMTPYDLIWPNGGY
ncbi:MAG TPA: mammalian cell entry protein [Mycolicibacillus parakoreensis]|nr:mammalian cell entry protein [Mycolicibacillus parakoreensis]